MIFSIWTVLFTFVQYIDLPGAGLELVEMKESCCLSWSSESVCDAHLTDLYSVQMREEGNECTTNTFLFSKTFLPKLNVCFCIVEILLPGTSSQLSKVVCVNFIEWFELECVNNEQILLYNNIKDYKNCFHSLLV